VVASEILGSVIILLLALVLLFNTGVDFGIFHSFLSLLGITVNTGKAVYFFLQHQLNLIPLPPAAPAAAATTTTATNLVEYVARFYDVAPKVLTKEVLYPLLSFFCWWYTLCLSVHTSVGYVHVNLWQLMQEDIKEAKQNKRMKKKSK